MTDIVAMLRDKAECHENSSSDAYWLNVAASEIERLRAEVERLSAEVERLDFLLDAQVERER